MANNETRYSFYLQANYPNYITTNLYTRIDMHYFESVYRIIARRFRKLLSLMNRNFNRSLIYENCAILQLSLSNYSLRNDTV